MMPSSVPQPSLRNIYRTPVNNSFTKPKQAHLNKNSLIASGLFHYTAKQAAGVFFIAASTIITTVCAQTQPASFSDSSSGSNDSSTGTAEGGSGSSSIVLSTEAQWGLAGGVIGAFVIFGIFVLRSKGGEPDHNNPLGIGYGTIG